MARIQLNNDIASVMGYLGFSGDYKIVDFFSIENKTIHFNYFRTEGKIKGFEIRDFIRLQYEMFKKGWLHTNIFYQANGKITSKFEKIDPEFIDNIYSASKKIAFNSPLDQLKISENSPIDNSFVYVFATTTEKNSKNLIMDIAGNSYKNIDSPIISDNGFSVCFKDKNSGFPVLFIASEGKLSFLGKLRKVMNSVHDFSHEDGSYALDFDQRRKFYDAAFDELKMFLRGNPKFLDLKDEANNFKKNEVDSSKIYSDMYKIIGNNIKSAFQQALSDIYEELIRYSEIENNGYEIDINSYVYLKTGNISSYNSQIMCKKVFVNHSDILGFHKCFHTNMDIGGKKLPIKLSYGSIPEYEEFHLGKKLLQYLLGYADCIDSDSEKRKIANIISDLQSDGFFHFGKINFQEDLKNSICYIADMINGTVASLVQEKSECITNYDLNNDNELYQFCEIVATKIFEQNSGARIAHNVDKITRFVYIYFKETKIYIKGDYIGMNYLFLSNIYSEFFAKTTRSQASIINGKFAKSSSYGNHISKFCIDMADGKIKFLNSNSDEYYNNSSFFDIHNDRIRGNRPPNMIEVFDCYSYVKDNTSLIDKKILHTPNNCDENGNNLKIDNYKKYVDTLFTSNLANFDLLFKFIDEISNIHGEKEVQTNGLIAPYKNIFYPFEEILRVINNRENEDVIYYHIDEDEVIYEDLDRLFSFGMTGGNYSDYEDDYDGKYFDMSLITQPAVIPINDTKYSLGRIGYHLRFYSGVSCDDAICYRNIDAKNVENGEITKASITNYFKYLSISTKPHSAFRDNSATTGINSQNRFTGKAGHPHFASNTFLCHAGAGRKDYYRWLVSKYNTKNTSDIIAVNTKSNNTGIIFRKSDFCKFLDEALTEVHGLTKSCYNRKTRSHAGLNIEEWGHCRIE